VTAIVPGPMRLDGIGAFVAGGASGLGAATARELVARGARVAVADVNGEKAAVLAEELGDAAASFKADVTDEAEVEAALAGAVEAFGSIRFAVGCAGIGWAEKVVSKAGPAQLQPFETVVRVNLIGMFNVLRLSTAAMNDNEPDENGERGAIVMTASAAAYEGQIGQTAYSASKGGIVGMTLPAARPRPVRHAAARGPPAGGPRLARRHDPLPEAPRQARGVRPSSLFGCREYDAQRRGHPARRCAADGAALSRAFRSSATAAGSLNIRK
jgi:NAD(P)-dependent dehydrogenase (short-subunit alcohol dehydrogenase family)